MNKIQAKRLLNVARALRESEHPERFTMRKYVWGQPGYMKDDLEEAKFCGTPACALGHYAARADLQKLLVNRIRTNKGHGIPYKYAIMVYAKGGKRAIIDDVRVVEHFGLTLHESDLLFGQWGCGEAQTPVEAASFIERFVKGKMKEKSSRG